MLFILLDIFIQNLQISHFAMWSCISIVVITKPISHLRVLENILTVAITLWSAVNERKNLVFVYNQTPCESWIRDLDPAQTDL